MTLANKFTLSRLILSPLFFVIYLMPVFHPELFVHGAAWTVPVFWLIFIVSEITDFLDGYAARKRNETSDFGKFFDPFADTIMQLTCFLCFVINDLFPVTLFLIIIYREFGILFIRNLMLKKGLILGASIGGKIKTVSYIIAAGFAILITSLQRLSIFDFLLPYLKTAANVVFIISVVISVLSFIDYLFIYLKAKKSA